MLADSPDTEDSEARSVDTRGDGRRHNGDDDDDDDTNVVDDVTNVASVFFSLFKKILGSTTSEVE